MKFLITPSLSPTSSLVIDKSSTGWILSEQDDWNCFYHPYLTIQTIWGKRNWSHSNVSTVDEQYHKWNCPFLCLLWSFWLGRRRQMKIKAKQTHHCRCSRRMLITQHKQANRITHMHVATRWKIRMGIHMFNYSVVLTDLYRIWFETPDFLG